MDFNPQQDFLRALCLYYGARWRLMKANTLRCLNMATTKDEIKSHLLHQIRIGSRNHNAMLSHIPPMEIILPHLLSQAREELFVAQGIFTFWANLYEAEDSHLRNDVQFLRSVSGDLITTCAHFHTSEIDASREALNSLRLLTINPKEELKKSIEFLYQRVLLMPIRCYEKLRGIIDEIETDEDFHYDKIAEEILQPENIRNLAVSYIERGETFVRDAKIAPSIESQFELLYQALPWFYRSVRLAQDTKNLSIGTADENLAHDMKLEAYAAEENRVQICCFFRTYGDIQWRGLFSEIFCLQPIESLINGGVERYLNFVAKARPEMGQWCHKAVKEALKKTGFLKNENLCEKIKAARASNLENIITAFFHELPQVFPERMRDQELAIFFHSAELARNDLKIEEELCMTHNPSEAICPRCDWFHKHQCKEAFNSGRHLIKACAAFIELTHSTDQNA
ncbi:MAG: hypothetical protein A2Y10_05995 [Planctomycetes bacterium GWF2_41_51]|nr:MAG: hypothetical protein A2Y10_05995 [Planctomycetes bacterium GWF2_41_51]